MAITGFDEKGDNVCYQLKIEGRVYGSYNNDVDLDIETNFVKVRNTGNTKFMVDGNYSLFPGDEMTLGSANDINKVCFRHSFKKTDCVIKSEDSCCNEPRLEVYVVETNFCGCIPCPKS